MSKSVADVMQLVKDEDVKFVDFRFTDTRGKEQHVSVPVSAFDEDKFESGHAFDGSSIAGWKGIEASDMLLIPDADTAFIDPFYEESTLVMSCDVVEPADGKGYERDPRSLAKRAEAYLKSSGLGDTAFFGPEPEFFIFDSVRWSADQSGCFVKIGSEEAPWSSSMEFEGGNTGHRPGTKGGYFPVAPVDTFQDIRSEMCLLLEQIGIPVEVHHHEVAGQGQNEIGTKFSTLVQRADWTAATEVHHPERRAHVRQDGDVHAEADRRRQRFGHARSPVDLEGRQEPVRRRRLCRPVGIRAVLHRRHHQACSRAERDHEPVDELVQASRAALRSTGEARLLGDATVRHRSAFRTCRTRRAAVSKRVSRIRWRTRTCASPR